MHLTLHSDYGLRVLMYLGLRGPALVSIRQVAAAYGISAHHLTKVVQRLARAGFVETVRGRGGGLRLAMPPEEIRVGTVFRCMEEDLALVGCFADPRACPIAGACGLRPLLAEALNAFLAVLGDATLADLIEPKRAAMSRRLGIAQEAAAA